MTGLALQSTLPPFIAKSFSTKLGAPALASGDTTFLLAVSGVALLFRLPFLGSGLWRDEGSTYFDIAASFPSGIIQTVGRSELSPPGYYLIMALWTHAFGFGELALKLPSLFFGVLLVLATYWLGRRLKPGCTSARFAAGIAATSPTAIILSQNARAYTLAAFLGCLGAIAFLQFTRDGTRFAWLAFVACATACIYVQYTGVLFLAAISAVCLAMGLLGSPPRRVLFSFAACMTAGILAAPLVPALARAAHVGNPWGSVSGNATKMLATTALAYIQAALPATIAGWSHQARAAIALIIAVAIDAFVAARSRRIDKSSVLAPVALVIAIYLIGAIIEANVFLGQGLRYMFIFEPLGWAALGFWLASITRRAQEWSAGDRGRQRTAWATAVALIALYLYARTTFTLHQAASAASGIKSLLAGGATNATVYLIAPDFMAPTFGYYVRAYPNVEYHGFAQWNGPQYIDLAAIRSNWNSPRLVTETEKRIASVPGKHWLDVVTTNDAWGRADTDNLRLSQIDILLRDLNRRYRLVESRPYHGRDESIVVYRYAL